MRDCSSVSAVKLLPGSEWIFFFHHLLCSKIMVRSRNWLIVGGESVHVSANSKEEARLVVLMS